MTHSNRNRLVEYLASACTNTGRATFYNTHAEQTAAMESLHAEVLQDDRRAYALSAALPINDRNRQLVVFNLIALGQLAENRTIENRVIDYVTRELPLNRALNLLVSLCRAKVNNARLRRICNRFWEAHGDAFRAVKYRTKFRTLLRHCHIGEGDDPVRAEVHRFVFGRLKSAAEAQHNPLLRARLNAAKNLDACFELPLDIGRDIAVNCHGADPKEFTARFTGKGDKAARGHVTRKESMRAGAQVGARVEFNRFSLIELLQHGYRVGNQLDSQARSELMATIDRKAIEESRHLRLPESVHVIIDDSGSAKGSEQREFHALAVIEATARAIRAVATTSVTLHFVSRVATDMTDLLKPHGATDLRMPLAKALAARPDLIVLLSDGYENVAAGSAAQVLATRAVRESGISLVHLNPVAAAEVDGIRRLSENLPTFGLSDSRQLGMSLLLGRATVNPQCLDPLFRRIENALEEGHHEFAKLV